MPTPKHHPTCPRVQGWDDEAPCICGNEPGFDAHAEIRELREAVAELIEWLSCYVESDGGGDSEIRAIRARLRAQEPKP